jgi:hypothetical protein
MEFAIVSDDLPELGNEARSFTSSFRRLKHIEEALSTEEEGVEMTEDDFATRKLPLRLSVPS